MADKKMEKIIAHKVYEMLEEGNEALFFLLKSYSEMHGLSKVDEAVIPFVESIKHILKEDLNIQDEIVEDDTTEKDRILKNAGVNDEKI
jgi:hypothetical protein